MSERPSPKEAAKRLVYVTDETPGIRRVSRGGAFAYRRADGSWLRERADAAEIARIRKLAIPPAYTDVWIAPSPHAHLQATGRDARGRKQYRYHPDWRAAREADKFGHMRAFGEALPRIRRRVAKDLATPVGRVPSREAVLAALVRLLDTTLVRVGNDEYAKQNGSFGLTTLRDRHAAVERGVLRLRFKGKSGVLHEVTIDDPRVARIVQRCQAVPGQELFQYEDDDGTIRTLGSADVNDYLREVSGEDITAKDFRTWHATVHALELMCERCALGAVSAREIREVLGTVSARLRNTVAVCRKSYVHPGVLDAQALALELPRLEAACAGVARRGLQAGERRLLCFLRGGARRLAAGAARKTSTRAASVGRRAAASAPHRRHNAAPDAGRPAAGRKTNRR